MYQASIAAFKDSGIAILAAAVADYRPEQAASHKIKKTGDTLDITLTKTADILKTLGTLKAEDQLLVGFALETNDERANAMKKLQSKGADMIVLNSLNDEGAGFGHDTNKVTLIHRDGTERSLPLLSKGDTAAAIVNAILEYRHEPHTV
jgi:phosphopantothenoylcysteine decarboxylase/phosphopantothenate--cysteine ligase